MLGCALNRREIRFTVLFGISKDCVNDVISVAHLDSLEEALVLAHVLEHVGLQVAICDENSAPGYVFECLLECLDHLLHSLIRCLATQDLKYVLIDHLNFLDINFLAPCT